MRRSQVVVNAVALTGLAVLLGAQSNPQPAFEVASIKPNQAPPQTASSNFPLGPGDAYNPNGGYFNATNFSLATYIAFAYRILGNEKPDIRDQLPDWGTSERYDIQARVPGNPTKTTCG